jgi:hypothetical protein
MGIGDLVQNTVTDGTGIIIKVSGCGTMAWVAWMHLDMNETRIPSRHLEVLCE